MDKRLIQALVLVWAAAGTFFWQFDLTKGNPGYYDIVAMAPFSVLHATVFYALILVSLYFDKYSLFNVLSLALYYPIIQLANYPFLTFRDVYLHGAPARTIISTGNLEYARDPVPEYWPSSFVLNALVAIVLGCDVVEANYLLYIGLLTTLALAIHSLAKTFRNRGYVLSWACPPLLLALFSSPEFQIHHYARFALSLVFVFLFLLAFVRSNDRRASIIQLFFIVSLITTHPFNSLYAVMFLFAYVVLGLLIRREVTFKAVDAALFSAILFFAWWLFRAWSNFEEAIPFFFTNIFSSDYFEPLKQAPFVSDPLPLWGIALRSYYKYSLLALTAIGLLSSGLILFANRRKRGNVPSEIVSFMSVLAVSTLFIAIMLGMPAWSLYRAAGFVAIAAGFSSIICVNYLAIIKGKGAFLLSKRTVKILVLVLIVSLSLTGMILRFERNSYFGELQHPSELSSLSFLFANVCCQQTVAASWKTIIYCNYFDYASKHKLLMYIDIWNVKGDNQTESFRYLETTINGSSLLIRGIRDTCILYNDPFLRKTSQLLLRIDEEATSRRFNRVCANGYYCIYSRIASPMCGSP